MREIEPEEIGKTVKQDGAVKVLVLMKKIPGKGKKPMLALTEDGEKYIEKMFGMNCSTEEVAADLGISSKVLLNSANRDRVERARIRGHERFLTEIRQQQRNILKRGDSRMAIWLGKQYLGQSDKVEASVTVEEKTADTLTWDDIETLLNARKRTK